MAHPFITALCPTWCRPDLLQTAVACWADQDYPRARTALVIGDDIDTPFRSWSTETFATALNSQPRRADRNVHYMHCSPGLSLPAKYNDLARRALFMFPETEILAVWEDDDLYLPHHLRLIADASHNTNPASGWYHPDTVGSDYRLQVGAPYDSIPRETTGGRFHGALALEVNTWKVHPWIETESADFDQQYLAHLRTHGQRHATWGKWFPDVAQSRFTPSYIFRWHTGHHHGQSAMRSPHDESWRISARMMLRSLHEQSHRGDDFVVEYDPRAMWLLEIAEREARPAAAE